MLFYFACFFAVLHYGSCMVTGWSSPFCPYADDDFGDVYMSDRSTGTIYTFTPIISGATVSSIAIRTQTVNGFFVFVSPTNGVLTLSGGLNVLDSSGTTSHVLTVEATDSTGSTGLVTMTIKVQKPVFQYGEVSINLDPNTNPGTTLLINALVPDFTNADIRYSIERGSTNADFAVVSSSGALALVNTLTETSGNDDGHYYLTIHGVEMIGSRSTATSYVTICLYGRDCSRIVPSSAADMITAGVLSCVSLFVAIHST